MPLSTRVHIPIASDELPSEVRLLHAGVNRTEHGPILFDDQAACSVAAAAARRGVDVMIDLEHRSLHPELPSYDPDARGWGKVSIRRGPELWLASMRFTPDGEARLREKRQRYLSPVIYFDTARATVPRAAGELLNVALTALPATRHASPLVAASLNGGVMDPSFIKTAIESAHPGVAPDIVEQLARLLGLTDAATFDEINAAITTVLATVKAANDLIGKPSSPPSGAEVTQAGEEMKMVANILGVKNGKEVLEKLNEILSQDFETRTRLVASLVQAGIETPVTAYSGGKLVARLQTESLDSMRARLAASLVPRVKPPVTAPPNQHGLSDRDLAIAAKHGVTTQEGLARFAELKAKVK